MLCVCGVWVMIREEKSTVIGDNHALVTHTDPVDQRSAAQTKMFFEKVQCRMVLVIGYGLTPNVNSWNKDSN
jgi:hypothetical protein